MNTAEQPGSDTQRETASKLVNFILGDKNNNNETALREFVEKLKPLMARFRDTIIPSLEGVVTHAQLNEMIEDMCEDHPDRWANLETLSLQEFTGGPQLSGKVDSVKVTPKGNANNNAGGDKDGRKDTPHDKGTQDAPGGSGGPNGPPPADSTPADQQPAPPAPAPEKTVEQILNKPTGFVLLPGQTHAQCLTMQIDAVKHIIEGMLTDGSPETERPTLMNQLPAAMLCIFENESRLAFWQEFNAVINGIVKEDSFITSPADETLYLAVVHPDAPGWLKQAVICYRKATMMQNNISGTRRIITLYAAQAIPQLFSYCYGVISKGDFNVEDEEYTWLVDFARGKNLPFDGNVDDRRSALVRYFTHTFGAQFAKDDAHTIEGVKYITALDFNLVKAMGCGFAITLYTPFLKCLNARARKTAGNTAATIRILQLFEETDLAECCRQVSQRMYALVLYDLMNYGRVPQARMSAVDVHTPLQTAIENTFAVEREQ